MTQFDPYRKWLGIPPQEQPPNHYRLLGVGLFEADPDVIANAADRQMVHVRSFQSGKHSDMSQRILNELAAARVCLLDPAKKAAYDESLSRTLAAQQAAGSPIPVFSRPLNPFPAPQLGPRSTPSYPAPPGSSGPPPAPPMPPPVALPVGIAQTATYEAEGALAEIDQVRPVRRKARKKRAMPLGTILFGLVVVVLVLGLLLWQLVISDGGRPSSNGTSAPANPQTRRPSGAQPGDSETKPAPRKERPIFKGPASSAGDAPWGSGPRRPLSNAVGEVMRWKTPTGVVSAVGYSSFGDIAAFGGPATASQIWDLQTNNKRELKGVDGTVLCMAFSPNGGHIVVGTGTAQPPSNGKLAVCKVPEGEVTAEVDLGKSLLAHDAKFSPSGKLIAMACEDGAIRLVQVSDGKDVKTLSGHKGPVRSVAFSLDDNRLVSGGDDGIVRVWDVATGKPLAELEGHAGAVASVAMSLDGKRAVSGGADKTVRIWDIEARKCLFPCQGHTDAVTAVAYSPDGICAVSGSADGTLRVWRTADGSPAQQFLAHEGGVLSVRVSGDGRHAVSGGKDGTVRIWGMPDLKKVVVAPPKETTENVAKPSVGRPVEPTAEQQAKIEKQLREDIFKADFDALNKPGAKSEAKKALVDKLLAEGAKPQSDAATSFVVLRVARDMAVEIGEADSVLAAIDEIDKHYTIDEFAMKLASLGKMADGAMPLPKRKALTLKLIQVVDDAAVAEHFDAAGELVKLVREQAVKAREPAIAKQAIACEKNLERLKQRSEAIKAALETLKKTPADPEANLAVGKHYCFVKSDWSAGLKYLAASSDADLKALAAKELATPTRREDQLAVGHAWWDAGEKQAKDLRGPFQRRAAYWYRKIKPKLIGLDQTKVEQRLAELGEEPSSVGGGAASPPLGPDAKP